MRLLLILLVPLLASAEGFSPAKPMPSAVLADSQEIDRIIIGSCFDQTRSARVFDDIAQRKPDAFLFMGDNVYAEDESDDPALMSLREAYGELAALDSFARLRESVPVLTVWDDHDYGLDDAGGDWPRRQTTEKLYEHVWAINQQDPRAMRDGIYFQRTTGPEGRRVQFILLDTRFFRTPLTPNTGEIPAKYVPSDDPAQTLLGERQWQWFETQLRKPADVRVIVSTILVHSEIHGWESWRMMPRERERFYGLLRSTGAGGVIIASGDTHAGAIYRADDKIDYPLLELNASSMNLPLTSFVKNPMQVPGVYRLGDTYFESNYGMIDINWQSGDIELQLIGETGETVRRATINLSELN